ncbi:GlxA family transcriptional regulator [Hoyosella subflava]|uniref:AraC family transcriptional regulator n=1 Tax=Hoyosella subflava (strain DSM 45089 / JCM 17490 / NBRC 109087 / DQS3-9A1) TaxID=443218 RepID=F6ER51_HOYSD|nr:GlxA family transcriptional regulator [Hoyosella subflava]AEF40738.1 AraC family transcriptional regulator [Hoyosella subflava DQS3-9A1]
MRCSRDFREVVVVVFDGCNLLDIAGPTDVFRTASLLGSNPGYTVMLASPSGKTVRTESGISIGVDASLTDASQQSGIDTLLVAGGLGVYSFADDHPAAIEDLQTISATTRRTTSVCSGAAILARAGLLDGYRATTHWAVCGQLQTDHPAIDVEADAIYVRDRDRWTSAGVTAGIDLALALVEDDCGSEIAHQVASWLVVFLRRPGGQSQFSMHMRNPPARTPALVKLQRWLPDHLAEDLSVETLASRVDMSPRNFARLFRKEVGVTPAVLVESLRVEAAKVLLETTDLLIPAIATQVGFGRPETLHRAFARRAATTPGRYRQHFQTKPKVS